MQATIHSSISPFSKASPSGLRCCAGLRLYALRKAQIFLARSAYSTCAHSYIFRSAELLLGISFFSAVSNSALKPTRLRQAAHPGH